MSTKSTTTTTTMEAKPSAVRGPNPKDSMKSTWRMTDRKNWGTGHWFFEIFGLHQSDPSKNTPKHDKSAPVPHVPELLQHRWVLFHAFIPMLFHQAWVSYTGKQWHWFGVFIFYDLAFQGIAVREFQALCRMGHTYGFLDGDKHDRDGVPDVGVSKVAKSLISTALFRMLAAALLAYSPDQAPYQLSWLALPLEIGLYGIILDFWFYWYHRLMHDVGSLWQYHRTHHLTKHPNALLTLYADEEQEVFDIVGIPLMAWATMRLMGLPMGFYEWWICQQYVTYAELAGHSGIRIHSSPPSTLSWLLKLFDCELVIEDHDLHHRKGWKSSYNYGKQTRLWDTIFGTCCDRIENTKDNIDYVNTVPIPLWW